MFRRLSAPVFFLLVFLPFVVLIGAGAWVYAGSDYQQRLIIRQAEELSGVGQSAGVLERSLVSVANDVLFLSRLPRLQEALLRSDVEHLAKLAETFSVFAEAKQYYNQIRWIDETGVERQRVDFDRASRRARILAPAELQNKSDRYYFKAAKDLAVGEIYASPFDLNIEAGAIETPFNPTLRLATPLIDRTGNRRGIVILNLFGSTLLERMLVAVGNIENVRARLMLVNSDGYWLHGLRREDEWGFMLGQQEKTMGQRHPQAWQRMLATERGQANLDDGVWTWQRVHPSVTLKDGSETWTVAAWLPAEELAALRNAAWRRLQWPLLVLGGLALLACALMTRYRAQGVTLEAALRDRLTEAEASNRQLAMQERFIRTITNHLPSKVSYWDTELRCRYANAAYFEWFGKHPEEMLGMHVREVQGDALFAQNEPAMRGALAGEAQRFERFIVKPDGSSGWLMTNYVPDRVGDRVDGFYVLSTDITEIKQAGLKLNELNAELSQRVDEVLAATRAKDDFLSNMSHEIRTPLNAILGLAYLLDSHTLTPDDRDLVHKIRGAGRMLLGIISDILDFSKIEAGRLELEHVPFRLGDVLDGVAAIMSTTVGDKDIELTVDAVPPGADSLVGDALRLGQVLTNLVSNAIKFTERGAISLHVSHGAASEQGIRLRFAVRDTGVGIPADKQQLIFEAFSQADSSTTRKYGGTGLGLSISRYLVHLMGGELAVSSTPGEGSEFYFTLPFATADISYALPSMAMQRVLIADDSVIARENLCATVHSLGWSAEAVDSGVAAVERCRAQAASGRPFDLLLIDWRMPGMDGLEASRAVRDECGAGHAVPIVAMVTSQSREILLAQPGVDATDLVLTKPVTASMLYNAVAEAKRRRGQGEVRPVSILAGRGRQLPGLRVLVVDDSEINCEVALRILEGEGARVQTVSDGQSALDWLRQQPDQVDVVLMDVQMPVMDGYEATRQIRGQLGRHELPVVALTAGAFSYQREAALAAGMNDFLAKPFDVEAMIATLQRLTGCQAEPAGSRPAAAPSPLPTLPGIDTVQGLLAWGNDVMAYRKYLRLFNVSYAEAGRTIAAACAAGDAAAAGALAHKLSGAAGNLALPDVAWAARQINAALHAGYLPATLADLLQASLETVAASLARWDELAGRAEAVSGTVATPDPVAVDAVAASPLLRDLLSALDRDSPRHAEPILAALAAYLPSQQLAGIGAAIDSFDFRGAEAQCRAVAAELGIPLET